MCPPAGGSTKRYIDFTKAPPICISKIGVYDARVVTDVGSFVIQMPAAYSLTAVNNFIFLARYHFYDSTIFHRVIPGFAVQGGDPTGTGAGGPGYSWTGNTPNAACAAKNDCYPLYSVAVANSGSPTSNGSQGFFIVVGASGEQLSPNYTLFGKVVRGPRSCSTSRPTATQCPRTTACRQRAVHHIVSITITPVTT